MGEWDRLEKVMGDYVFEYNLYNKDQMDITLFKDALQHIARISRILRQPRGNVMLIGVGGR